MEWSTLLTGIGAILTGAGGCVLLVREFRRRDRVALTRELNALGDDVLELRTSLIICRRYAYLLVEKLADNGIRIPEPENWKHE